MRHCGRHGGGMRARIGGTLPAAGALLMVLGAAPGSWGMPPHGTRFARLGLEEGLGSTNVFTISQDLPFALERYCTSLDEVRHPVLSDHVEAQFGTRYGLLIKGMRLLARAIHVVAPDGRIAYVQIVPELTDEPDYDAALAATRKAAGL